MPTDCVTFQNSGYFSKIIVDYLNQEKVLQPLYNRFPNLGSFKQQIEEKQSNFDSETRKILAETLKSQYQKLEYAENSLTNIELLKENNTFTITTGHQLNLFTGPLYFLYKIISTIKLCQQLKSQYPEFNFVPIYWMATEDHDFEEINHFNLENKVIHWNQEGNGPVGRRTTEGLEQVYEVFAAHIGIGKNAEQLKNWFKEAYINHDNLSDATRYLAHQLFNSFGLVILDADNHALKELFIPHLKHELIKKDAITDAQKSFSILKDYTIQVNPREINLFYISDSLRERIIFEENQYRINNTNITFSENEIIEELKNYPEKFSPNVILRPLYQEVILPNLSYIGGGGELAYWLELKEIFKTHQITFPILLLRNSVLLASQKQEQKRLKMNVTWSELFLKKETLINQKTMELSKLTFDFNTQRVFLERQFEELESLAYKTDKSFIGAVKAQKTKQLNGLNHLEKRLLKAEKKSHQDTLMRLELLQNELFPYGSLQERTLNFSEFYKEYGSDMIEKLLLNLEPLDHKFDILVL